MTDDTDGAAGEDLDSLVRRVDPDRWLSSRFIADDRARREVIAVYAYDHELVRAATVASNPLLAEIRLTWWREVLDEIYAGGAPRRHPTALALAAAVTNNSLPRGLLEAMIDARIADLDDGPLSATWASDTGGAAAVAAARILDPAEDHGGARAAGAAWALARRLGPGAAREALEEARRAVRGLSVAAFPAVAHAALANLAPEASQLRRRMRLILAVATGRI